MDTNLTYGLSIGWTHPKGVSDNYHLINVPTSPTANDDDAAAAYDDGAAATTDELPATCRNEDVHAATTKQRSVLSKLRCPGRGTP